MKVLGLALLIALEAFGQVAPSIQVDFTNVVRAVSPLTFGLDSSGYGNPVFPNDSLEQLRLKSLNLGMMRMELKYAVSGDPNSKIECGGAGCATSVVGDNFINAIKAAGAEPVVITDMYKGNQTDSVTDAVNLVTHFNVTTGNPVHRWILGNEPDNNSIAVSEYVAQFNAMYDAMKAVDPTILIGGPAAASFNKTYLTSFLAGCGSRVDFVDFHAYGEGSSDNLPQAQLLAQTQNYEDNLNKLRTMIQSAAPGRAASIGMEVGEWNMNWNGAGSVANMYTEFNTVWGALTIGHILNAGGLSMQYADKNGPLGALYQSDMSAYGAKLDDPMPVYYAHGMFTGEGLFQHFGAVQVAATTTLPLVNVWASDHEKNIVVVNADPANSQNAVFGLTGVTTGSVEVWRKDPSETALAAPELIGTIAIVNGSFSYTLTPYSVTVFVLDPRAQIGTYTAGQWYLDVNGNGTWDSDPPDLSASFGWPGATYVTGDWNGDGRTKMGVYQNGFWYLDYDGNGVWDGGVNDKQYVFGWGNPNVIPVVGDWNGDGRTKIGVYYNGFWYLDYDGNGVWDGGVNDKAYSFGWAATGVTPMLGDWSGTGTTKIGIYYYGFWYLDYDGDGVWNPANDKAYTFGWNATGVTPVLGDWNGDGRAKIGIYYYGSWYLDYDGNGVWEGGVNDKQYNLGWADPAVMPVIGDWSGSGTANIGVFYNGYWYLDYNGNGVWDGATTDRLYTWGQPGDTPVVGNW
jgi:hypothetical protein